jgi:sodium transport system permease protein
MKRDSGSTLGVLYRHEMRSVLRDRRTIIASVVLPVVVIPLMLYISTWSKMRREEALKFKTYPYTVVGTEEAFARTLTDAALARMKQESEEDRVTFVERDVEDAPLGLKEETIEFFVEALTAEEAEERSADEATSEEEEVEETETPVPVPALIIHFRANRDSSRFAAEKMSELLRAVRRDRRAAALQGEGFPLSADEVASVEVHNVATAGEVGGAYLGRLLTLIVVFLMLTGGSVVATDSLAGEKERGTLETLLTTAADRQEIVAAKQLSILTIGLIITLIQLVNISIYVGLRLIEIPEDFAISISPLALLVVFLLYLPMAALVSSVLLLISGYAKTYKEAQLYFFPVFLVGLLPAVAALLPGLRLRSAIAFVPVANISVAVKEVLGGRYDWPFLVVAWLATAGAASYAAKRVSQSLANEKLISIGDRDVVDVTGGAPLFARHVLRWFAILWAVLLIASANIGSSLRLQLFTNLIVLFLGGSLFMIWKYRLNIGEALALRPVKPWVWPAVIIGVPATNLAGAGIFRLANLIFPVPERVLEAFGESMFPADIPFWHLFLFFTILPGICEEMAFRGVLLYGLHRRFRPWVLVLVVGGIFGLFHIDLFRLLPVTFIGSILTAVTLMTGSIFPAMLWHALNNGWGLIANKYELPLAEMGIEGHLIGAAVLVLALWIIWKNRTPYPGLKVPGTPFRL